MGCLLTLIALALPRGLMVFIWLLTDWFGRAFKAPLWPLLGFFFMPYTTLAYIAAMLHGPGVVKGGWLVLVIVAVLVDLGHLGGGGRTIRRRRVLWVGRVRR